MRGIRRFFARGADAPSLEDAREIDRLYSRQRRLVLLTLTLTYGFSYTCRLGLSVVKKPLLDAGVFSAEELGRIGAGLLYGYAAGKFLSGFVADRANVRRLLPFGLLVSAALNLGMGWSTWTAFSLALWCANGLFQGTGAPSCVVSITQWFGDRERGRAYGIWSTAHALGEGMTFVGTAALVSAAGWRAGFWGPAVACIAAALAAGRFLRDRPETLGLPAVERRRAVEPASTIGNPPGEGTTAAELGVLRMPAVWVLGFSSALLYVTRYAIDSWGVLYLQEHHGYSLVRAGSLVSLSSFTGIAGCAAYGFLSDTLFRARRPPLTLVFGVLEVVSLLLVFLGPRGSTTMLGLGLALYGFTLSGLLAVLGGLFAVDIAPKRAAGTVMGFIGLFSYVGAGAQDAVSGLLLERGKTTAGGASQYDFSAAIALWIGASVLSMLLAATLWKVRPAP